LIPVSVDRLMRLGDRAAFRLVISMHNRCKIAVELIAAVAIGLTGAG
jgi:hypothetical protein